MAVSLGKSPIIMTAQGDTIANDGRNWRVANFRFLALSSGSFIMLDAPGGREIARSRTLSAGESEDIQIDSQWFDGLYLSQSPAGGGNAYIYYM